MIGIDCIASACLIHLFKVRRKHNEFLLFLLSGYNMRTLVKGIIENQGTLINSFPLIH